MSETLLLIFGAVILAQVGFLIRAFQKIHIISERNKYFEAKTAGDLKDHNKDIELLCTEGSSLKKEVVKLKSWKDTEAVTKNDKAFAVLAGTIQEALSHGEGLFLVTRMNDGSYLWKVPREDVAMTHASSK